MRRINLWRPASVPVVRSRSWSGRGGESLGRAFAGRRPAERVTTAGWGSRYEDGEDQRAWR
ncbi:hypothetical protein J2S43_001853 [Catenuloplanes nepalensis]|uniref:Uncharacterized protein n=1 Tax=Catenuloplanes nepalensis TaxID=587533 RepID=A0ABT9MQJ9_9ACTN|nr:hypothetical protein [Catenuloplanes nepalensis]MDP9793341.1 hypothetical protein [Catenuloplanes nepalensis]